MKNLFFTGQHLSGARDMLLVLMERCTNIDFVGKGIKDASIYNKAIIHFLLSDKRNMDLFLVYEPLRFYDHKRDNNGKLTSVKVCFESDYKQTNQ